MEFEKGQVITLPVTAKDGISQKRYFHVQEPHEVLPVVLGHFIRPLNCCGRKATDVSLVPNVENNIKEPFAITMDAIFVIDRRRTAAVYGHLRDDEQQIIDLYVNLFDKEKLTMEAGIDELNKTLKQQYLLLNAIEKDGDKKVNAMLDVGVNIDDYLSITTLLHWAVKKNAVKSASVILSHGGFVDALDCEQKTPLFYAVDSNKKDMAQLLLEAGASPRIRIKGRSVYEFAHTAKMRQVLNQASLVQSETVSQSRGRSL